jgi:hypothetical protein
VKIFYGTELWERKVIPFNGKPTFDELSYYKYQGTNKPKIHQLDSREKQNFDQKLVTNHPNSTADREKEKQKIAHTNLNNFEIKKNNIFQQVNQFVKELTKEF